PRRHQRRQPRSHRRLRSERHTRLHAAHARPEPLGARARLVQVGPRLPVAGRAGLRLVQRSQRARRVLMMMETLGGSPHPPATSSAWQSRAALTRSARARLAAAVLLALPALAARALAQDTRNASASVSQEEPERASVRWHGTTLSFDQSVTTQ